jgi:hypothetical protein
MISVVTDLAGLTPEWLTACLAERYPGIRVGAARVAPLEIGPSYHGNLGRIDLLDVTGADVPSSLVAKLVSGAPAARALGIGMGIYLREALFYAHLSPSVRLQPPICHGVAYDPDSRLSAILLEDLTALEVGMQDAGYTPERARATVLQLADQHAAFWDDASLADHVWLPIWNQPEMVAFVVGGYAQVWPACRDSYTDVLDGDAIAVGERLAKYLAPLMTAIGTAPVTLLHGDARYDNLLFDPADPTAPPRTVDWQFVARGRGAQDLAYFLTQSAAEDHAAAHERELVAAYHARLVDNGVEGYPADACWDDYRRCALYSLVYPVFTAGMVDASIAGQRDSMATFLRRGFAAALRLESMKLL